MQILVGNKKTNKQRAPEGFPVYIEKKVMWDKSDFPGFTSVIWEYIYMQFQENNG